MNNFNPLREATLILCESSKDYFETKLFVEDVNSPLNNKYLEKLYDSVLSKDHIDFDDIPNSKGDIKKYSGYTTMNETLKSLFALANQHNAKQVVTYINTINTSISNIDRLADLYETGFKLNNQYVIMEYNTYVYTCVQATTTILMEFVDYIKRPDRDSIDVVIINNKQRANIFYIEQLDKFNNVVAKMEYRAYLKSLISQDKEKFIGVETAVGIGATALVAMAIVPVTREIIYRVYSIRSKISEALEQQAYFLELNKANVNANSAFTPTKKKEILRKQESLKNKLLSISDKLRVSHAQSGMNSNKLLQKDNKLLTIDRIKKEYDSEPLSLL